MSRLSDFYWILNEIRFKTIFLLRAKPKGISRYKQRFFTIDLTLSLWLKSMRSSSNAWQKIAKLITFSADHSTVESKKVKEGNFCTFLSMHYLNLFLWTFRMLWTGQKIRIELILEWNNHHLECSIQELNSKFHLFQSIQFIQFHFVYSIPF